MQIEFIERFDLTSPTDLLLLPVLQGKVLDDPLVSGLNLALDGALEKLAGQEKFKAKDSQSLNFNTLGRIGPQRVTLLGLGPVEKLSPETFRRAGGRAAESLQKYRVSGLTAACQLPEGADFTLDQAVGGFLEGLELGLYRFEKYKSKEDEEPSYSGPEMAGLFACDASGRPQGKKKKLQAQARHAALVTQGVLTARDMINEIPEVMTPENLAKRAGELAAEVEGIKVRVLDEKAMAGEKMAAALAVARGSENSPRFIELVYDPPGVPGKEDLLVMVGKGVTFDSGGLNIKPGEHMATMKMDMSGAAAVISAITVIARLKLPLRVAAVVAAVENMPSGRAYRPDDVVRAMNGTTIEVGSTDAEGRLTLADALSWAITRLGAGRIVDLATLTGSCVVGLGPYTAGAMGNDKDWLSFVLDSAREAGEKCSELPLDQDLADDIKSEIADVKNIGATRFGGAIAGALFLEKFVRKTPWVHLDIAGPAWAEKKRHYQPAGGTGFGVRLLVRLAERLAARGKQDSML
ncbi:MAG TPA: leucyl aminopeptidase [archaeon]|nr:leucyl aminopeptidase [archaeon]